MEISDYSKGYAIIEEPSLAWWCPLYLNKNQKIMYKVKSNITNKYVVDVPQTISKSRQLDKNDSNNQLQYVLDK